MATILLLSGPNLNLLGEREPEIYGTTTLDDLVGVATKCATDFGHDVEHVQSNGEAVLIDAIQRARGRCAAIVINPGALTHYARSIADALATFEGPVVELHLSNTYRREQWRHTSVVSPVATGVVAGFGAEGYDLAIRAASRLIEQRGAR